MTSINDAYSHYNVKMNTTSVLDDMLLSSADDGNS